MEKKTIEAREYGKSIYGDWYCTFIESGCFNGLHAPTYKELKRRCKECNITLNGSKRKDN